jgi:hypothetical protein
MRVGVSILTNPLRSIVVNINIGKSGRSIKFTKGEIAVLTRAEQLTSELADEDEDAGEAAGKLARVLKRVDAKGIFTPQVAEKPETVAAKRSA